MIKDCHRFQKGSKRDGDANDEPNGDWLIVLNFLFNFPFLPVLLSFNPMFRTFYLSIYTHLICVQRIWY